MKNKFSVIRYMLPLIIFLALAVFLWQGLQLDPHRIPSPLVGKPVPRFSIESVNKPQLQLTNQIFKGHVSMLNVFASWCITCRAEHAVMMDIYDQHVVNLYGLAYKDSKAELVPWLHQFGDPYQKIINDSKGQLAINLGVYGTPETFIIDKKGIIRYKRIGAVSPSLWQHTIKPLIARLKQES